MKKLILLAFGVLAGYSVLAQGTIQFQNGTVSTAYFTNSTGSGGTRGKVSTAANTMAYALFYAPVVGGQSNNLAFATSVFNSTGSFGVIQGNNIFTLNGVDAGQQAYVMVLAYDGSLGLGGATNHYIGAYGSGSAGGMAGQWDGAGKWFAQSPTIIVTAGAVGGPGSVMYLTPGDASHLGTGIGTDILPVPEPSLFTLAGLGAAGMMIFRRRR